MKKYLKINKVKSHALRSLGLITKQLTPRLIHQSNHLLSKVVFVLLKTIQSGSFKVRWNGCHCITNMLSNPNFPLGQNIPYTKDLIETLSKVTLNSMNFKVKTSALLALSAPKKLSDYSHSDQTGNTTILEILKSIKNSLETIEGVNTKSTYEEQKLASNFIDTILLSLKHFEKLYSGNLGNVVNEILELKDELIRPKKINFDSVGA